jgi:hypothetical protein
MNQTVSFLAVSCALAWLSISEPATAAEPTPDQFIISYWHGLAPADNTPERFKEMARAGFNLVMPHCAEFTPEQTLANNRRILDLSAQHGMKTILHDPRLANAQPNSPDFEKTIAAVVADYASHPALYGYNLADEPVNRQLPRLAAISKALLERDPRHLPFINLVPIHATGMIGGYPFTNDDAQFPQIVRDYDNYLEQFLTRVKPKLLSYDEYDLVEEGGPFHLDDNGMLGMYFPNLEVVREKAIKYKIPFNNIILVTPHAHAYGQYRDPSLEELRFLVYTTLVYGARGIMYFTYASVDGMGDGIIGHNGRPTKHYDQVSQLNKEIRALAPVLITLRSDGVYHVGRLPKLTKPLPAGGLVQRVEGGEVVLGLFSDLKGSRFVMVVNKDYKKGHDVAITFSQPVGLEKISAIDGRSNALPAGEQEKGSQARWKITLAAGEGTLLKLLPQRQPE